jgi:hypothetical protein
MGPRAHVQDLQGVEALDPAGTLSKQRLAVPDHIEAERDALAQGIGEGRERTTSSSTYRSMSRGRSCPVARCPAPEGQASSGSGPATLTARGRTTNMRP